MKTYLLTTAVLTACLATANAGKINLMCPKGEDISVKRTVDTEGNRVETYTGKAEGTLSIYAGQTSKISFDIASDPVTSKAFGLTENFVPLSSTGDDKGNFVCLYNDPKNDQIIAIKNVIPGGANSGGRHRYKCAAQPGTPGVILCKTSI